MRNISIGQIFVIFIIGVLIFSDFSKILKNARNVVKNNKIYKNLKKK
jgi:Sec-independent protein translocase protein TatA|nr:twin arginine protein translocation system - TatA protein [Skeletonema subsalsum]YP_010208930.1 twin arginine protein translocation system - TatA protein [Skeletonema potamos]UBA16201.1 twin arginine protein translocation system - TatA protein [Skeletonema subsalsum]UBA16240.1 twin arginine protein translocation system - TatA protein [Skeletonema potamos]